MKNSGWKFILVGVAIVLVGIGFRGKQDEPTPKMVTYVTPTAMPQEEIVVVGRVVDGDTIDLKDGRRVRYIGINTPELSTETKPTECYAQKAFEKNALLVKDKPIRIRRDVSDMDAYGRLLRYVWVDDTFVNEYLVKEGYAHIMTIAPDVTYAALLKDGQSHAKQLSLGLWGAGCVTSQR